MTGHGPDCLEQALTRGGDNRIWIARRGGVNQYGCAGTPDPRIAAFGSSTASSVSPRGYGAAQILLTRLNAGATLQTEGLLQAEADRIRRRLLSLCRIAPSSGVEAVLAASGTDAHLILPQLIAAQTRKPLLVIMPDPLETGRGAALALGGRHFSDHTALGAHVDHGAPIAGAVQPEVVSYRMRDDDGEVRPADLIDNAVANLIEEGRRAGRHILLVAIDGSKTGLIAPRARRILQWKARYGGDLDVLIDACQFRLSPATVNAYLAQDFTLAVTGSKFVGGPAFSGALLFAADTARRLKASPVPAGLGAYSARADWPEGWAARDGLDAPANPGLLLRWEAALAELDHFRTIPEDRISAIVCDFDAAMRSVAARTGGVRLWPGMTLERRGLIDEALWDQHPTMIAFELAASGSRDETAFVAALRLYDAVQSGRLHGLTGPAQIGRPVLVGGQGIRGRAAYRLALGAPLIGMAYPLGVDTVVESAQDLLGAMAATAADVASCAQPLGGLRSPFDNGGIF